MTLRDEGPWPLILSLFVHRLFIIAQPPDVKDGPTGNRYYSIDTFVKIRTIRIFQNLGLSLNEIRGYFDDSVDLPQLIGRLETLRDELDRHIEKLRAYARQHGLTPTGKLRRIYLEGPPQHKDPAKFVTQVALPLEEE